MDAIDRRSALRHIMCAAVTAGFGATLLTGIAKAVPLALEKDLGERVEDVVREKPQTVQNRRHHHRPDHRRPDHRRPRHRRRRRKVCWWRKGRRVCVWRY